VQALRDLEHTVHVFDQRAPHHPLIRNLPAKLAQRIRWRISRLEQADRQTMQKRLIALHRQLQPDFVFVSKGDRLELTTLHTLRRQGALLVNWFPDDWQQWPFVQKIVSAYDLFCIFDNNMVAELQRQGCTHAHYLPFACDPSLHRTVELSAEDRRQYETALCFVGSAYPERVAVLQMLARPSLTIWGPAHWQETALAQYYRGYIPNGEPLVKLLNAACVALNVHWQGDGMGSGANFRTFEIAGCGGAAQVVDARADIPALFAAGKEVVIYRSPEEMCAQVNQLVAQPDLARQMAHQAQRRAHCEHSYRRRMSQLLDLVATAREQTRGQS
jgi:spore maturation protein CgeB